MTGPERVTGWDEALQAYLDSKRDADMACAYFAMGAVEAVTGVDFVPKFRGRLAWARDNLEEAVGEVLEPRGVSFARNGDLVMVDGNLGVCHGEMSIFMALHDGRFGTTAMPTLGCDKAWTVG